LSDFPPNFANLEAKLFKKEAHLIKIYRNVRVMEQNFSLS
jgi:hypothetical protein